MSDARGSLLQARPTAEEIHALRSQGYGWRRMALMTGTSIATLRRIANPAYAERLRQMSKAAKKRRHGVCERCGGTTNYGGVRGRGVSRFCATCGVDVSREATMARRGTGPTQSRVLAFIGDGERRFMEIADHLGVDKNRLGPLLIRLLHYGLIERTRRGVYRKVA